MWPSSGGTCGIVSGCVVFVFVVKGWNSRYRTRLLLAFVTCVSFVSFCLGAGMILTIVCLFLASNYMA